MSQTCYEVQDRVDWRGCRRPLRDSLSAPAPHAPDLLVCRVALRNVRLRCQRGSHPPARRRPGRVARPRGRRPAGARACQAPLRRAPFQPPQRARTRDRVEPVRASSPDERDALRAPAHVRRGHAAQAPPEPVDNAPRTAPRIAKLTWSWSATSTCAWCSRWLWSRCSSAAALPWRKSQTCYEVRDTVEWRRRCRQLRDYFRARSLQGAGTFSSVGWPYPHACPNLLPTRIGLACLLLAGTSLNAAIAPAPRSVGATP